MFTRTYVRKYIHSNGLPEQEAAHIMADIFRGLGYLHSFGIANLDLSFENVLTQVLAQY